MSKAGTRTGRSSARDRSVGLVLLFTLFAVALLAVGCAIPASAPIPEESAKSADATPHAKAPSRCAPGRILDDRHTLCNGRSGRWW